MRLLDTIPAGNIPFSWEAIWSDIKKAVDKSKWSQMDIFDGLMHEELLCLRGGQMTFIIKTGTPYGMRDLALYGLFAGGSLPNRKVFRGMVEEMEAIGRENGAKLVIIEGRIKGWSRIFRGYETWDTPSGVKVLRKVLRDVR